MSKAARKSLTLVQELGVATEIALSTYRLALLNQYAEELFNLLSTPCVQIDEKNETIFAISSPKVFAISSSKRDAQSAEGCIYGFSEGVNEVVLLAKVSVNEYMVEALGLMFKNR